MIILDSIDRTLEVLLGGSVTTNQLPIVASYVDFADGFLPGSRNTQTNGTTAVTAVSAPIAGMQRQIKFLSVFNADVAVATITVRYNDNSAMRTLFRATLAIGDNLTYTDGEGFRVVDSTGFVKQTPLSLPLGITNGGTGQVSQSSAFDALAPPTTKGDLIAHNGTNCIRVAVGSDGQVLTADSAQSSGVRWATGGSTNAASQAEMEAASSTTVYASPGRTQYHPGVAKGWAVFNGVTTTTITTSHNVSSLTDNGTGDTTINWTTAFSSGNYVVSGSGKIDTTSADANIVAVGPRRIASNPATGSVRIMSDYLSSPGNASDCPYQPVELVANQWASA